MSQSLPPQLRRPVDLFEIGFVYLFLPAVVSTMDRTRLHLGGSILLWMMAWFFVRRLPDMSVGKSIVSQIGSKAAAISGIFVLVAGFAFALWRPGKIGLEGAPGLFYQLVSVSVPLVGVCFGYLPSRFRHSDWLPAPVRAYLPAILFGTVHIASLSWQAPLVALVAGGIVVALRIPLVPVVAFHSVCVWLVARGSLW